MSIAGASLSNLCSAYCLSDFSVAVLRHHDQSNLRKGLFGTYGLRVQVHDPQGREHGIGRVTESSHLETPPRWGSLIGKGRGQSFETSKPIPSDTHSPTGLHLPIQTFLPPGDQICKHIGGHLHSNHCICFIPLTNSGGHRHLMPRREYKMRDFRNFLSTLSPSHNDRNAQSVATPVTIWREK